MFVILFVLSASEPSRARPESYTTCLEFLAYRKIDFSKEENPQSEYRGLGHKRQDNVTYKNVTYGKKPQVVLAFLFVV